MIRTGRLLVAAALGIGCAVVPGPEASAQEETGSVERPPGDELEVFLVTAAWGDVFWERFGHNAIWIRDREAGTDVAYNWGIFSFRQESFLKRLIQGRMLYSMESMDMGGMAQGYRNGNRSLYVNPIHLTPRQRLDLLEIVERMDTDETRHYRYDYYLDNCSTRVRDALDEVLGGRIRSEFEDEPTGTTFRWHTARLLGPIPWAYYGIQLVLGHPGDREISAWEEMFLPVPLLDYLEDMRVVGPDGTEAPLLGERRTLFESDRGPAPIDAPSTVLLSLVVGLVVAGLIGLLGLWARRGSGAGRVALGAFAASWSGLIGLLGTGLVLSWILTDHVFWRWNENVLLVSPLGLPAAWSLILLALDRGAIRAAKWTGWVAGLSALGFVIQILPGFDQVNGDVIALVLPANLVMAWVASRIAREGAIEPRPA